MDEYGANLGDYVRYTKCAEGRHGRRGGLGRRQRPGRLRRPDRLHGQERAQGEDRRRQAHAPADTAEAKTAFDFSLNPGAIAYSLTDGSSDTRTVEPGKAYTVTEADARAKGYKLTAIDCTSGTSDVATRSATVTPTAGETVTCTITNTKLVTAIDIEKSGPATATAGDLLTYTLDVTNPGEMPFAADAVAVTDASATRRRRSSRPTATRPRASSTRATAGPTPAGCRPRPARPRWSTSPTSRARTRTTRSSRTRTRSRRP